MNCLNNGFISLGVSFITSIQDGKRVDRVYGPSRHRVLLTLALKNIITAFSVLFTH